MEQVTKFKAVDGKLFDTEHECCKYELMLSSIDLAMSLLCPRPDDSNFINGEGYVQQEKEKVETAMREIVKISGIDLKDFDSIGNFNENPFSYRDSAIGMTFNEITATTVYYREWYRFMCMDNDYREWGEPYYSRYPEKRIHKKLN
jgi:hypothetical protein